MSAALATHFGLLDPAAGAGEPTLADRFIEYRHPVWDDDWADPRGGFRFTCPECGWRSPTMKYRVGANRHADRHECRVERTQE